MRARRSGELMRAYLLLLEVRSGDESHSCLPGRVNFGVEGPEWARSPKRGRTPKRSYRGCARESKKRGPDQALREHNPWKEAQSRTCQSGRVASIGALSVSEWPEWEHGVERTQSSLSSSKLSKPASKQVSQQVDGISPFALGLNPFFNLIVDPSLVKSLFNKKDGVYATCASDLRLLNYAYSISGLTLLSGIAGTKITLYPACPVTRLETSILLPLAQTSKVVYLLAGKPGRVRTLLWLQLVCPAYELLWL